MQACIDREPVTEGRKLGADDEAAGAPGLRGFHVERKITMLLSGSRPRFSDEERGTEVKIMSHGPSYLCFYIFLHTSFYFRNEIFMVVVIWMLCNHGKMKNSTKTTKTVQFSTPISLYPYYTQFLIEMGKK
jgi:hypothetical protein